MGYSRLEPRALLPHPSMLPDAVLTAVPHAWRGRCTRGYVGWCIYQVLYTRHIPGWVYTRHIPGWVSLTSRVPWWVSLTSRVPWWVYASPPMLPGWVYASPPMLPGWVFLTFLTLLGWVFLTFLTLLGGFRPET